MQKTLENIKILKVQFDKITLKEATQMALGWAKGDTQKQIVTPNPEIILQTQKNHKFLSVLNKADLSVPDGTGILWASKYLKITETTFNKWLKISKWLFSLSTITFYPKYIRSQLPERITGTDLMQNICKHCPNERIKIFLLGGQENVVQKAKDVLETNYPGLNISGVYSGSAEEKEEKTIIEKINHSEAKVLFVAFGSPNQEMWIARNLNRIKTVKVAMGVGGAFDFISGEIKRAPKWMQKFGIEWLFRLLKQPLRIRRIYNATVKFPLTILRRGLEEKSLVEKIKDYFKSFSFFPKNR